MPCRPVAVAVAVAGTVLVLLAAAGCSNRESAQARASRDTGTATARVAADGVQQVIVTGNEQFRFVPSKIAARPGRLRIILVNSGGTPHDLQVDGAGQTGLVGAAEREQITVTLGPGRHGFTCTLHTRLHMTGTIVVS